MIVQAGRTRSFCVTVSAAILFLSLATSIHADVFVISPPNYDVNKYWSSIPPGVDPGDPSDSLMCWAATVSNVLMYTNWGYDRDTDGTIELYDDLYHEFLYAFPNTGGSGSTGYSHYLGTYWPTYNYNDYFHQYHTHSGMLPKIDEWLHMDYGLYLSITTGSGIGHAITAWGYETDPLGNYTKIAITDSDDHFSGLKWIDLNFSGGKYYLSGYPNPRYYIRRIDAFEARIPEPSTLFLLGSGILWIIGYSRRRRRDV
jgi:hypothetical protein